MNSKRSLPRPLLFLYIIFAYVLAFSIWWAYLLYQKNELSFKENIELKRLAWENKHQGSEANYHSTEEYQVIFKKFERQRNMILMEGSVFIFIMLFGFFFVRRSILKEFRLADLQTNFLMSITHELKSPLASVKLVQQTLQKRELPEESRLKLIANSLIDLDRLDALVDNILIAAKIENDRYGFSQEALDLSSLLYQLCDKYTIILKGSLQINTEIEDDIEIIGDRISIISLIVNLIDNAIKYSEENAVIHVSLKSSGDYCKLEIADNGPGIPEDERGRIFDKFYRIGSEETRRTKGTGLGLYIVKRIILIHQGSIEIASNQPKGTRFKVRLPRMKHI